MKRIFLLITFFTLLGNAGVMAQSLCGDRNGNNIIDGTEIAGDKNEDGKINVVEICGDLNGDGIIGDGISKNMEIAGDKNGDGKITGAEIAGDINGDGVIDFGEICGDKDGDRLIVVNELAGDRNGDYFINGTEVLGDANGDGVLDHIAGDKNNNGVIDGGEIAGDIDQDGDIELYSYYNEVCGDINGNRIIDGTEIAGDKNGDGVICGTEICGDRDGNGIIDGTESVGDKNGNGYIDGAEVRGDANGDGFVVKALTISTPTITTKKPYDGTTTAAITPGTLSGVAPCDIDNVILNATATYNDKTVGYFKTITVTYSLSGPAAAKYSAPAGYTTYGEITQKELTADVSIPDKFYDGTTTANVIVSPVGVVAGEEVVLNATANYSSANAGADIYAYVMYSSPSLSGKDAANYTASLYNFVYTKGTIKPLPLTVAAPTITLSKAYDGTTTAVVTPGALTGVLPAEAAYISLDATATYDNATVGTGKTVTVTYNLNCAQGPGSISKFNYITPASTTVSTGVITKRPLTASVPTITLSKEFDGTTTAVVDPYIEMPDVQSGVLPLDRGNVFLNAVAAYDNAAVGTGKKITVKYTLSGSASASYATPSSISVSTGVITGKLLTVANPTITINKVYDGTTTAAVTPGALSGVDPADAANLTLSATAAYDNAAVGTGKTITVTYTLSGSAAAKYIVPASSSITIGVITAKALTVAAPTITLTKPYDGTATAAVTSGALTGVLAADAANVMLNKTATYNSYAVGTGKTITVTYTLTGTAAANYTAPVGSSVTTGVITAKPLTVAAPTLTLTKPYDGTATAAVTSGALTGVLAADAANVTLNKTAIYNSSAVGTGKTITVAYTLTGTAAANYTAPVGSSVTTGVITAKPLTVAAPTLTLTKPYDGTATAAVTSGALTGVLAADAANVMLNKTATYNSSAVGTGKTITVAYTLTGTAAANYTAPVGSSVTTGVITAKPLTVAAPTITLTKPYDGTITAAVIAGTLTGVLAADAANVTLNATATYNSAAIGTAKTITVTYALTGTAAANYTAPVSSSVTTGVITSPAIAGDKNGNGVIDGSEIAGDVNGDGKITAPEIAGDTNGDGKIGPGEIAGDKNGDGKITFPEIAGDKNGNGVIDGDEISGDANGDGKITAPEIAGDTNGDGKIGSGEIAGDKNGDGKITFPEIAGDKNGNGVIDGDEISGDANGDGKITAPEIAGDTNGDGKIGSGEIAGDKNGDGKITFPEIAGDKNGNGVIDGDEIAARQLKVNVYLEGLWNGTSMNKTQAYDAVNDVLIDKFAGTIADTISVELHDMTSYATILYQAHGLELHQDGSITSAGLSYIEIPGNINGAYRITIKHRNHLEVASASSVSFSSSTVIYDFTDSSAKAFASDQTFTPTKLMNSKWMLYAGNIVAGDYPEINNDDLYRTFDQYSLGTGVYGYLPEDMNGDGFVDDTDFYMVLGNLLIYFYLP